MSFSFFFDFYHWKTKFPDITMITHLHGRLDMIRWKPHLHNSIVRFLSLCTHGGLTKKGIRKRYLRMISAQKFSELDSDQLYSYIIQGASQARDRLWWLARGDQIGTQRWHTPFDMVNSRKKWFLNTSSFAELLLRSTLIHRSVALWTLSNLLRPCLPPSRKS